MDYSDQNKHCEILSRINLLPKKILSLHSNGDGCIAEFVLHELCGPCCFDFEKAAYFVDNPDFNQFKGVAGFSNTEHSDKIWNNENPEELKKHFASCKFNQQVRGICKNSFKKTNNMTEEIKNNLAPELKMENVLYFAWPLKHENHGVLIYQAKYDPKELEEFIYNGFYLLGFCPIN